MKEILLIVPSFQRQKKIAACVQAWRDTTSGRSDFLLVLEDKDEPYPDLGVKVMSGDFGSVGKAMNAAVKKFPEYKFYAHINDDHHFRTKEWEDKFIEVLKDGGFAYGNDLLHGGRLSSSIIISGDIVRKLGYMAVPELDHLYVDNCWMDLGRGINKLFYLEDVVVEHMHPGARKAEMDAQYKRVNTNYEKFNEIYRNWKVTKLTGEVQKCL
jgi:hypothetical protein